MTTAKVRRLAPDTTARVLFLRLPTADYATIERAAEHDSIKVGAWCRQLLMRRARDILAVQKAQRAASRGKR